MSLKILKPEDIDNELNGAPEPEQYEAEKPHIIRINEALRDKFDFRLNTIRQVIEYTTKEKENWKDFEEEDLNSIWIDFQLNTEFKGKEKPSVALLDKLLKSRFTNKHNAIREFFKSLKWEGTDHIAKLADLVKISPLKIDQLDGQQLEIFWRPLFKRWLISACSCGMGFTQNHVMLLFIGGQGTGKTTFLNKLCPTDLDQYLYTGHINPELDKTTADLLAEKFIINIDDQLQSIFDKDFHKIKGLITATSVTNRKAYRRDEKKRPRIANFMGSVNTETIFRDVENRRYLTFKIDAIDYKKEIDINQVWAQAYHLLNKGERPWFDSEEVNWINGINNQFAQVSQEEEYLVKMYESVQPEDPTAEFIMFSEILANIRKASKLNLSPQRLQLAIKKLKWHEPVSKRINNQPRYVYSVKSNFTIDDYQNIKINYE
jgi:predicted P-loop ATPase